MTKKNEQRGDKRAPRRAPSTVELKELEAWVSALPIGVTPSVKVNGSHYPTAVVVVDLGQPLKQVRLNSEQSSELGNRLRRTAREIIGRDTSIRVSTDNGRGIVWASIA